MKALQRSDASQFRDICEIKFYSLSRCEMLDQTIAY